MKTNFIFCISLSNMLLSHSFVAISEKEAAWENKQKLIVCPGNEQIQGFFGGESSELETANY